MATPGHSSRILESALGRHKHADDSRSQSRGQALRGTELPLVVRIEREISVVCGGEDAGTGGHLLQQIDSGAVEGRYGLDYEGRPLHLLALTGAEGLTHPPEKYIERLFPRRELEQHFREIHKPMVLVTSRVHPG